MLAISLPAALRNMVDMGLSLDDARARLNRVKAKATMDGCPYYNPADIARAAAQRT